MLSVAKLRLADFERANRGVVQKQTNVARGRMTANRKDRHHIFPRGLPAPRGIPASLYNSICNICLLTAEENQMIGSRRPRSYLGEARDNAGYFKRKMARHLIPVSDGDGVWHTHVRTGFERMVRQRNDLICGELEREAGIRLFRRDS